MLALAVDFSVIKPDVGLLFWTLVIFALAWFTLGKVAFKPIAQALKEREDSIDHALKSAEEARAEMAGLKAENEAILRQAQEEKAEILRTAKDMKNQIVSEARDKAKDEANKIVEGARQEIENLKQSAMADVKANAANMALEVAEKLIREHLKGQDAQEKLAASLVEELKLN